MILGLIFSDVLQGYPKKCIWRFNWSMHFISIIHHLYYILMRAQITGHHQTIIFTKTGKIPMQTKRYLIGPEEKTSEALPVFLCFWTPNMIFYNAPNTRAVVKLINSKWGWRCENGTALLALTQFLNSSQCLSDGARQPLGWNDEWWLLWHVIDQFWRVFTKFITKHE